MPQTTYDSIIEATVAKHPPEVWRSGLRFRADDELTALRIAYHFRGQYACSIEQSTQQGYTVNVALLQTKN